MSTRPTPSPRPVRFVAAAATAVSAVVHLLLYLDGYSTIPVVGPMFVVNAIAGVVIAVALVISAHPVWALLALGFHGASLVALALTYTEAGFFDVRSQLVGTYEAVSFVSEAVGLLAAAWLLLRWWRGRSAPA